MRTDNGTILYNREIAPGIYSMKIESGISAEVKPGQFVQVAVPGFFLRRPISVTDASGSYLILVYRVVGDGTEKMSQMKEKDTISLFGPLGNGFPVEDRNVLLIGGGIGVPPLLYTAKAYRKKGYGVHAALGFNTSSEIILKDEFARIGCDVHIATMDGSDGTEGTALDVIQADHLKENFVLACGPLPMLRAVSRNYSNGYVSLESRMACGMGACMGCVVQDQDGKSLRVCRDGPVFPIGKVVF